MIKPLVTLFVFVGSMNFRPTTKIDLSKICKKPIPEIEAQLGRPLMTEDFSPEGNTCMCRRSWYLDNQIAVTFTDGKSDWIWVKTTVSIFNEDKAAIKSLNRFKEHTFIKCQTMGNTGCCRPS